MEEPLLGDEALPERDCEDVRPPAPPPGRPDFGVLMGGVRIEHVQLAKRSKTNRLLLDECSLQLVAGEAAVVTGYEFESKTSLLLLLLVRMSPFKGHVAFQLPDAAIPAASHLLRVHNHPGAAMPGMAGEDGDDDNAMVVQPGGPGWKWATFSFRRDNVQLVRAGVGFVGVGCCGIFRTTVEDNIAVATTREVTSAEVREVCRRVGAHEELLQLPDGYATLVGEGSGHALTQQMALRIGLARALIRRPRLLLVDHGDQIAEAVGPERLAEALRAVCDAGGCVIVSSNQPELFPFATVYGMQNGKLNQTEEGS